MPEREKIKVVWEGGGLLKGMLTAVWGGGRAWSKCWVPSVRLADNMGILIGSLKAVTLYVWYHIIWFTKHFTLTIPFTNPVRRHSGFAGGEIKSL